MAKYMINDSTLTGIADAIREKTESTEAILVSEMVGLIRSITAGTELTIVVSVDSGATVTATKGDLSVSVVSVDGTATLTVPEGGVWTVTATLDGKTATASVELVPSPTAAVSFVDATFANNSWAQIIAACESGSVPDTWAVGNSKTMTINGTDYQIDIIGKNHDEYSDGSGKAPLTFQMHDCYATNYGMNSSATTTGGWTSSVMRNTHLPTILALMPSEVIAGIKEVSKLTSAGGGSTTITTTADKLFLLSEVEVFGGSKKYSPVGEGAQYAYYSAGNSALKYQNLSAWGWWLRSPRCQGTNANNGIKFNLVSDSSVSNAEANKNYGVSFAFCF